MLWRVTLAVALLCGGSICGRVGADLMSSLIIPRDYGVKLCGREFIRAVIFTCGGSRWRRSAEFGSLPWTPVRDERGSLGSSLDDLLAVYRPDRKKRNFSLGVAGKCCSQGCTKNDIGRLC
ncbi:prorelaxin H1 [Takifugu flavidus]|uniref:Insulin n=1 Tax=Takifugu flavidus TaxID=433684 RepID=A0A5C6NH87_9TELE|nr:prorelaxin H1 [Takifugu flavidus]TWW65979.1 Relaxin-3 Insulin-like peptide INSL7 [Takifugu flavidus]